MLGVTLSHLNLEVKPVHPNTQTDLIKALAMNIRVGFMEEATIYGGAYVHLVEAINNSDCVRIVELDQQPYMIFGIINDPPDIAFPWMFITTVKPTLSQAKAIITNAKAYLNFWRLKYGTLVIHPWIDNHTGIKFCKKMGFQNCHEIFKYPLIENRSYEITNPVFQIQMTITPMYYSGE